MRDAPLFIRAEDAPLLDEPKLALRLEVAMFTRWVDMLLRNEDVALLPEVPTPKREAPKVLR